MKIRVEAYVVVKVLSGIPGDAEVFLSRNKAIERRNEIESEIDEETDSVGIHETNLYLDVSFVKNKESEETKYRILRKTADGEWINLYPPAPGGTPPTYVSREDAEERALRIEKNIGVQTRVVTLDEAENHEQPKKSH